VAANKRGTLAVRKKQESEGNPMTKQEALAAAASAPEPVQSVLRELIDRAFKDESKEGFEEEAPPAPAPESGGK
jgi:hypothetical protein